MKVRTSAKAGFAQNRCPMVRVRLPIKSRVRSGVMNRCETVRLVKVHKTIRTGIRSGLGNRCETFSGRSQRREV